MDKQLFIPNRINVGFQKREGTYTGKLAYVIYYDLKGKLRKEASWNSWRDKKITPIEFDNTPTDGFVLNKGVGGQRQSYGWNARNEYIRVYDPRDFEFEISVANLLFILRECDCSKGKGLEGKFVYAWDGTELVLLPEISTDYQTSRKFTDLQACKVKAKEMILGATYITKKQKPLTYLGRFEHHFISSSRTWSNDCGSLAYMSGHKKQHVFWDGKCFVFLDSLQSIATLQSEAVIGNYAELVEKYNKSIHGSKIVRLFTRSIGKDGAGREHGWVVANPDGSYDEYYTNHEWKTTNISSIQKTHRITLNDGKLKIENDYGVAYPAGTPKDRRYNSYYYDRERHINWVDPTGLRLYAELESGSKAHLSNGSFTVKGNRDGEED